MIWPNGSKYEGEWRDDKMHGNVAPIIEQEETYLYNSREFFSMERRWCLKGSSDVVRSTTWKNWIPFSWSHVWRTLSGNTWARKRQETCYSWKMYVIHLHPRLNYLLQWREFKKDPRFCSGRGILIWQKVIGHIVSNVLIEAVTVLEARILIRFGLWSKVSGGNGQDNRARRWRSQRPNPNILLRWYPRGNPRQIRKTLQGIQKEFRVPPMQRRN